MDIFVRIPVGEEDAALQAEESQTALLHLRGRWKIWRCWQGVQKQSGGTVLPLCLEGPQRPFLSLLKAVAAPSLLLLREKTSFGFSSFPCPCGCRALCFPVQPWIIANFSEGPHICCYFRYLILAALWVPCVNPDAENAP